MSAASKVALYSDDTQAWGLIEGDALLTLAKLPDAWVDAIVTDPPYGIAFGGEAWDGHNIRQSVVERGELVTARHALARWTQVWASEAARVLKPGGYLLAFGAPRTFHRLVCGIEDAGMEVRDVLMWVYGNGMPKSRRLPGGRGTALKPAYEPILLARVALEGSTSENLRAWGTGALNIDATRIGEDGRWPPHLALSHAADCSESICSSACPARLLNTQRNELSRMFYCPKACRAEREAGCAQLPVRPVRLYNGNSPRLVHNIHPTVKPITLMRWLVRLVTPPSGLVLDPFTGSGSTGAAAVREGRWFLGIERESKYVDIACARLTHWAAVAAQEEVLP